jgi:hypothetical protein
MRLKIMPIKSCELNGKPGYQYGSEGKCYTYDPDNETSRKNAKKQAILQGVAISQNSGEKLEVSKEDINDLNEPVTIDVSMVKYDDSNNLIFGWAYVAKTKEGQQVIDHSEEFVSDENYKDLELATYAFNLAYRESDIGHVEKPTGHLVESFVVTKEKLEKMGLPDNSLPLGVWVGFWFPNDDDYTKIKKMKHPMFSLYGSATKEFVKEVQ